MIERDCGSVEGDCWTCVVDGGDLGNVRVGTYEWHRDEAAVVVVLL